jgi:hypothetical protein
VRCKWLHNLRNLVPNLHHDWVVEVKRRRRVTLLEFMRNYDILVVGRI